MDTVTVVDAEARVWHQNASRTNIGNPEDPPDAVLSGEDLDAISIAARAGNVKDEVKIDADRGGYDLRVGDRLEIEITIAALLGAGYGERYGTAYGGNLRHINWVGQIEPTNEQLDRVQHGTLSADATDWPGGILSDRTVTGQWEATDVGQIIREVVEETASEVDASGVPDLGVTTDQFVNERDVWDLVIALAAKADCVLSPNGHRLEVEPIESLTPEFQLEPGDYRLPWKVQTDDEIKNIVRVDSGFSRQLEESQPDVSATERVNETTRVLHRIRGRKAEVHSIELYVERDAADEDLEVRLQANESGEPVEVASEDSDIAKASMPADSLPGAGWQNLFFPDHTLPDRDPWVIVQTSGPTGHLIGGHNGTLAYTTYYPHPVNFETQDLASIHEYGPREVQIERDNLKTLEATRDAARSELARRAWPEKTITFEAASPRTHALEPGDVITNTDPDLAATGDYIVMERTQEFDASTVEVKTNITATWRKGVLAPRGG